MSVRDKWVKAGVPGVLYGDGHGVVNDGGPVAEEGDARHTEVSLPVGHLASFEQLQTEFYFV